MKWKIEVELKNCENVSSNLKTACELDNKGAVLDKKNNVNYMHEEMWSACND